VLAVRAVLAVAQEAGEGVVAVVGEEVAGERADLDSRSTHVCRVPSS
jgi:hypothetical protein